MPLERFLVNVGGKVRKDKLEGRECLVVPAAMMAEGVWNGSAGPLYYPKEELENSAPSWNHKPIVVDHPKDKDGNFVSACSKEVLNESKVGIMLNTRFDNKLRTECWFDIEKTRSVKPKLLEALEKQQQVEASTGVIIDNEEGEGEFGGIGYTGTARHHRPDHFAALMDVKGAYSIAAGGGILTVNAADPDPFKKAVTEALKPIRAELVGNEISHSQIARRLHEALGSKHGEKGKYWDGYVSDVYDGHVVYRNCDEKMYMQDYSRKGDDVSLSGNPVPVERVVEYRTKDNKSFSANSAGQLVPTGENVMSFDRKARIAELIGNGFEEADRPVLEALTDAKLQLIAPAKKADPPAVTPTTNATPPITATPSAAELIANAAKTAADAVVVPVTPATPVPQKQHTLAELLANAAPSERFAFNQGKKFYELQVNSLIERITTAPNCRFSKEQLVRKANQEGGFEELQQIADMVSNVSNDGGPATFNFAAGIESPMPTVNRAAESAPLIVPRTFEPTMPGAAAK